MAYGCHIASISGINFIESGVCGNTHWRFTDDSVVW